MASLDSVLACIDLNLERSLGRLTELVRIPSVSTDPAHKGDCRKAAEFLAGDLAAIGFDAKVADTSGHPMVLARHEGPAGAPHVLFYGHYDVQPVDPIELWTSDPFEATIVEGETGAKRIVGRGTADDKGQLMTFIEACRAYKAETGGLPWLLPFLEANKDALKADIALVCDTNMWDRDTPAISMGLRGLVGEEVVVKAARRDLHSGYYGGAARNPLHVLSDIVAAMHDQTGRVTIPGFYDGVDEVPLQIKAMWDGLGFSDEAFLCDVGLSIPAGEKGYSVLEQTWSRPTAEVNGMTGGYTGPGFKTVIAAEAKAKISFRLVFSRDPTALRQPVGRGRPRGAHRRMAEAGGHHRHGRLDPDRRRIQGSPRHGNASHRLRPRR